MIDDAQLCPSDLLGEIVQIAERDDSLALVSLEGLVDKYPNDPRLYFLRGSLLAGVQRYLEGREAIAQAVEVAPEFHLARFQLGFLELTSGEPDAAIVTWRPLHDLRENDPLRLFAIGLEHLARDEFGNAVNVLRAGIAENQDNGPLNNDMQRIIDEILAKFGSEETADQPTSSTHMLLQQFADKATRH